jgi:amino acid transporter
VPKPHQAADDGPPRAQSDDAAKVIDEDVKTLHSLGYGQELLRRMSGFSNFAISMSIICILAGCITSFAEGFSRVGGAAIGLGWPLGCLISLCLALTMAQVASAFPTAGGLYHWASILGGRGWGWATAWFNLAGLITVLAAINVGTYEFVAGAFRIPVGGHPEAFKILAVAAITFSQAMFNHRGIRITTMLTDFSGYLILIVAVALTVALLVSAGSLDLSRLVTFSNYSGPAGGDVVPASGHVTWLFLLGLLLPAYTVTGFDASAHTAEETVGAARNVPRGIVRSVLVSGIFGWLMLSAVVLAAPSMDYAAGQGKNAFAWIMQNVLNPNVSLVLCIGIAIAQYLCGLATVTSASRMVYAFARDGGLPCSGALRRVSPTSLTPSIAIWTVAFLAVAFTIYAKAYSVITAASVIFLYISYVVPAALGFFAYGRTWTKMGPWDIGQWYRVLAVLSMIGCGLLIVVCVWPPNDLNLTIVGVSLCVLAVAWFAVERRRFQGPPEGLMIQRRQAEIQAEEQRSGVLERIRSDSVQ